ncbi:uncharacterized protein K460DRAFT_186767 [Cucurbitaria berberidis CBS 394.84]|uniref:CFEM domain-containing protein n=1 Tax=Cucurbitaria berberidis CBS 394.84 TaxID=1168544 RepID=A0A9P4GB30_9PLEO|nr:uncharacterized protein K460DRAFT_186767 [Cucurbitaria berberidis CBS 394.84]KAF1842523.1 hypothetical protein K460DRAFT_186767 [Cucurbitaria berberidis CBS 394.84]
MRTTYTLLVTGLAAQQVAATWNYYDNFKTPQYNDNECSDKQKSGFDWSDLKDGDQDFSYGDFDFSGGWSCSSSFGKRDHVTKRTFGNKVIKNYVRKDKPASFGCGQRKSGFSITDIDVSVEFDVDLELHYTMTDGSKCKSYSPCSAGGSTIKNTQCGGAKSVDVYLGAHYKGEKKECEIGFHHIGFDCNPGKGYTPPPPPEVPVCHKCQEKSTSVATPPPTESTATPKVSTLSSATPYSSGSPYTNSSASASPPPPTQKTTVVPPPSRESSTVTPPKESSGVPSPPPSSSGYPVPITSSASSTGPKPSTPAYPPASPPDVLPKCMNTWLAIDASCKNNADKSCYCVNPEFTKNVIDCVSARCDTDEETKKALQYLIGICADYVPKNPKIIEDCPPYIPLNPAPAPTPSAGVPTPSAGVPTPSAGVPTPSAGVPGTTPSAYVPGKPAPPPSAGVPGKPAPPPSAGVPGTVTATAPGSSVTPAPPAPPAPEVPCTTITYGTTSLTVPQVHFTTQTPAVTGPKPTEPVGLVPGPPQTPAETTGGGAPYPVPTTLGTKPVPAGTGTGAYRPSAPAEFTGAASSLHFAPQGALFGAALAFFAL